jgi:hypothetical protein
MVSCQSVLFTPFVFERWCNLFSETTDVSGTYGTYEILVRPHSSGHSPYLLVGVKYVDIIILRRAIVR